VRRYRVRTALPFAFAAVAFSRPEKVQTAGLRIVADTAWAFVYHRDSVKAVYGPSAVAHVVKLRAVRVERRAGEWVAVRVDPKVVP
jgi:hypothetical protein